jgi:hypothetical protein
MVRRSAEGFFAAGLGLLAEHILRRYSSRPSLTGSNVGL